jgi:TPR repeat protein
VIRAVAVSAIIHIAMLCLAQFGVGPTMGFIAGAFSLAWYYILLFLLALLAFLLWLLFGTAALAGMGTATAVALVVAAVSALGLLDRGASEGLASPDRDGGSQSRPLDVALVEDPLRDAKIQRPSPDDRDTQMQAAALPDRAGNPAPRMFSAALGKEETEGLSKTGDTVRGKLWTVTLPSVLVTAAERTTGESLTRQNLKAVARVDPAHGPVGEATKDDADAERAQQTAALATERASTAARAEEQNRTPVTPVPESALDADAERPAPPVEASTRLDRKGVAGVFDRLARAMPRLAELRAAATAGAPPRPIAQADGAVVASPASPERRAIEETVSRLATKADEGFAHAQFALAEALLQRGRDGVDRKRARALLERAALGGYMPAQVLLAMVEGEGDATSPRNLAKAHAWLAAAARQGNPAAARARDELAREFQGGDAVKSMVASARLKTLMRNVAPAAQAGGEQSVVNEQLRHAAVLGDSESVHVLLARNADADDADREGRTPLIEAAWRGYPGIINALVSAGARMDARDSSGKDALSWAAINGHVTVIRALAAAGAPLNARDRDGLTALMRAAWNGHDRAVAALIAAGADAGLRDRAGRSAFDYAREQRDGRVLAALGNSRGQ